MCGVDFQTITPTGALHDSAAVMQVQATAAADHQTRKITNGTTLKYTAQNESGLCDSCMSHNTSSVYGFATGC